MPIGEDTTHPPNRKNGDGSNDRERHHNNECPTEEYGMNIEQPQIDWAKIEQSKDFKQGLQDSQKGGFPNDHSSVVGRHDQAFQYIIGWLKGSGETYPGDCFIDFQPRCPKGYGYKQEAWHTGFKASAAYRRPIEDIEHYGAKSERERVSWLDGWQYGFAALTYLGGTIRAD